MLRKKLIILGLTLTLVAGTSFVTGPCFANSSQARLVRGTARTLLSPLEIPRTMVEHSKKVMFPFGLVTGALVGTVRTVLGIVGGASELALGAAPYAKYAVFFI